MPRPIVTDDESTPGIDPLLTVANVSYLAGDLGRPASHRPTRDKINFTVLRSLAPPPPAPEGSHEISRRIRQH